MCIRDSLYAVESWYSWHSRDDYTNNIYSIRNAYYGSLDGKAVSYTHLDVYKRQEEICGACKGC